MLVGSELVTNVGQHGYGPAWLRLVLLPQSVRLEVYDSSPRRPQQRTASPGDTHGRGLLIVSQYADRWGTRRAGDGKCVWAEFGIRPATKAPQPDHTGSTSVTYRTVANLDRYRLRWRMGAEQHRSAG